MFEVEDYARLQIEEFLPDVLNTVLKDYEKFIDKNKDTIKDSGDFKKHHDACKGAISHIQHLIKLAQMVKLPEEKDGDFTQNEMEELINKAREEVRQYEQNCT